MNLVKSKLDPESLGIILLGPFLLEFFPDQVGHMTDTAYLCACLCAYVRGRSQLAGKALETQERFFYEGRDRGKLC